MYLFACKNLYVCSVRRSELTKAQKRALDGLEVKPQPVIDLNDTEIRPYHKLVELRLAKFRNFRFIIAEAGGKLAR